MYTDADLDMLESGSDSGDADRAGEGQGEEGDLSTDGDVTEDEQGPGFVSAFAEVSYL